MKRCFPYLAPLAFVAGTISIPMAAWGQTQAQPDTQAKPSSKDDSAEQSYLRHTIKFSGSIRERWEAMDGPFSATPADSYVISQIRLGMDFQPTSWLNFFAQAQDVRVLFYQVTPSNAFSDPFDLHQAYMSVGHAEGPGFFVQAGRQDMVIGSGHLLAATDDWWSLTSRNFDVIHGTYTNTYFKSQLVAGSAVLINPDGFDEHRTGDHIYADYNSFGRIIPGASVEPYFIVRTLDNVKSKEDQIGGMDTLALGGRIVGTTPGGFDYNFEPLHEFGGYSNDRLDANGLLTGAGWTAKSSAWTPRLSTDYEFASGDNGQKNGVRETFDNMFGYNYPMNSLTSVFDWKNLKDLRAGVEFTPLKKLKFKVNGRDFWLASVHDGLYNAYGTETILNPKATSAHVGESVEMMATATLSKYTSVGFGVATLFAGEYLKESNKDQPFICPYFFFAQRF